MKHACVYNVIFLLIQQEYFHSTHPGVYKEGHSLWSRRVSPVENRLEIEPNGYQSTRIPWQLGGLINMVSNPRKHEEKSRYKSFSRPQIIDQQVVQAKLLKQQSDDLSYHLTKFRRLDCPTILNPQNSSFFDVALHGKYMQRLSASTIEKRLRYARFMEHHPIPVDFRNPNYENFRRHMDYREEIENVSPYVLIQEWKTMRMFLRSFGIPSWDYKPPHAPGHKRRILPFPDVVNKFFIFTYSRDSYENALYQYMFFHSFLVGWRVPSEIISMTIDDVVIDANGRGCLTITETKKHKNKRTILPEIQILGSQSHKSFKNWIDHW